MEPMHWINRGGLPKLSAYHMLFITTIPLIMNILRKSRVVSAGKPTLNQSQADRSLKTLSVKTNYTKYLGGHNIKALAGYEQSKRQNEDFSAGSINFPTSATPELSQGGSAATDRSISGSSSIYTRRSAIGRVSYDYIGKISI